MSEEDDAARLRRWLDSPREQPVVDAHDVDVVGVFRHLSDRPAPDVWADIARGQGEAEPSGGRRPMRELPVRMPRSRRVMLVASVAAAALVVGIAVSSRGTKSNAKTPGPSVAQAEAALAALVPNGDPAERLAALNDVAQVARLRLMEDQRR